MVGAFGRIFSARGQKGFSMSFPASATGARHAPSQIVPIGQASMASLPARTHGRARVILRRGRRMETLA